MNKGILHTLLIVGLAALVFGCSSDKSSNEACLHAVTMNLDKGNYDAVLASPCADDMAKGAAWFGKAGFDIQDVINSLISSNTSTTKDLSLYMTALVPKALNSASLTDLDQAKFNYSLVPLAPAGTYKDAQFYISLVDIVKGLSLLKIALPNIIGPDGKLNTACDYNSNAVPDDGDATACELIASTNINTAGTITCKGGTTYSPLAPAPITLYYDAAMNQQIVSNATSTITIDTFSGLIISMSIGANPAPDTSGCNPAGTTTYKRLLYQDPISLAWYGATTTTDVCYGSDSNPWPCPVTGPNLDLVGSINTSFNSSGDALSSSITGTNSTDVGQAINNVSAEACTTPCVTVCPGVSCPQTCTPPAYAENYCSALDIANYIETNLQ